MATVQQTRAPREPRNPRDHQFPPTDPRLWSRADIFALASLITTWERYADQRYRDGYAARHAAPGFTYADLAAAHAAGTKAAYDRRQGAYEAGWNACLDRFADLIGGRVYPAHPTPREIQSWTRHSPRCVHGGRGGRVRCRRAGCIPGPRSDYGLPAPWDKPLDRAALRRSHGFPEDDAGYRAAVAAARDEFRAQLRAMRETRREHLG